MIRLIFTAFVLGSVSVSADGPPVSCCLKLRQTRLNLDKILTYRIQTNEMCPIRAVLIQTVCGRTLCSDPESKWTKRAMRKVDEERKKAEEKDPEKGASVEGRREREGPMTTVQMNKQEKSTTKVKIWTKENRSQGAVKSKKRKCEDKKW